MSKHKSSIKCYGWNRNARRAFDVIPGLQKGGSVVILADVIGKTCAIVEIEFDSEMNATATDLETGEEYQLNKAQKDRAEEIFWTECGKEWSNS